MKRIRIPLVLLVLAALACNFGASRPTPPPATVIVQQETAQVPAPATDEQPADEPQTPSFPGQPFAYDILTGAIPPGLASSVSGETLPQALGDDMPPWEVTPGHIEVGLDGYVLGEKFHQPRLYVFPVFGLAAAQQGAANNINRLNEILSNPGAPLTASDLPGVHFFNAGAVFAADAQIIPFQNGSGVRALTVYAQYFAPANNEDLFYHFQGLTGDGQSYIIAILPVTHPGLPRDWQDESMPPGSDFPAFPGYEASEQALAGYYRTVSDLLTAADPDSFSPSLNDLDNLIQSLLISP
ncbi:MAG: hypothetical protein R6W69_00375 [Anaerolineales bacterium]